MNSIIYRYFSYLSWLRNLRIFIWLPVIILSGAGSAFGGNADLKSLSLTGINLSVRLLLQGPYNQDTGLMTDQLRVQSLLPTQQPYSAAPFNYPGAEQLSIDVLTASGQDAVVDWVLLELLEADSSGDIVARQAAVLQSDGDVVNATSGETVLNFSSVLTGNYRVSVRHRNHQGAVILDSQNLSASVTLVDFSSPTLQVQGDHARVELGGFSLLRTGDANQDGRLIAIGVGNDSNPLLSGILTTAGNTGLNASYQQQGYLVTDFNLDGRALYSGPANDNNFLLSNILLHPGNAGVAANFIISSNFNP